MASGTPDGPTPAELLAACHHIGVAARAYAARAWADHGARKPLGRGAGGDITMIFDAALEKIAIDALQPLGGILLRSEEGGERLLGQGRWRVLLDPLGGSTNAKGELPFCGISIAAGRGERMADIE